MLVFCPMKCLFASIERRKHHTLTHPKPCLHTPYINLSITFQSLRAHFNGSISWVQTPSPITAQSFNVHQTSTVFYIPGLTIHICNENPLPWIIQAGSWLFTVCISYGKSNKKWSLEDHASPAFQA